MLELLAVIAPIALIDSTSVTPIALVPLASVLAGKRPYGAAIGFLEANEYSVGADGAGCPVSDQSQYDPVAPQCSEVGRGG